MLRRFRNIRRGICHWRRMDQDGASRSFKFFQRNGLGEGGNEGDGGTSDVFGKADAMTEDQQFSAMGTMARRPSIVTFRISSSATTSSRESSAGFVGRRIPRLQKAQFPSTDLSTMDVCRMGRDGCEAAARFQKHLDH